MKALLGHSQTNLSVPKQSSLTLCVPDLKLALQVGPEVGASHMVRARREPEGT